LQEFRSYRMERTHLPAPILQYSSAPVLLPPAPGSWLLAPGSWLLAPGSWLLTPDLTPALKISTDRSNLRL
jgi:hypothetical protein